MDRIFVRPARPGDAEQVVEFATNTPDNEFDPKVVLYPTTTTLAAYTKKKVVMYLPVQKPLMLEGLCANPESSDLEKAAAISELVKQAVFMAHIQKSGEIYFLGTEETVQKMAVHSGAWEKIPWNVYRMKISDLEPSAK